MQTCPWTQFPGNRLILSWKVEKGSYYLTQSTEETLGYDRELSQENEAEADHQTKVCLHSDFHIVCVCASVCVHSAVHVKCVCVRY